MPIDTSYHNTVCKGAAAFQVLMVLFLFSPCPIKPQDHCQDDLDKIFILIFLLKIGNVSSQTSDFYFAFFYGILKFVLEPALIVK